jgi:tyrosyl-tRNA synthetase
MDKELERKIEEVLTRGVERIYPSREAVRKALLSGRKLKIYSGIDPTGELHLGHSVFLRKLKQLQNLGHNIIVLIGDFTARIGDPTDKQAARKKLTSEEVKKNAANYEKLIGKILDTKRSNVKFLHNKEWTNKLKLEDMLELASNFTVSRLLERDMFQERLKKGRQIYVHEFIYPIFQAYDAATMNVDMEVGGNDQTFNMLAGRDFMQRVKKKEKFVMTTKLLVDPTGKKMGKTEGNIVCLSEKPDSKFGKIMAWPDSLIVLGFELLTNVSMDKIKKMEEDVKSGKLNPRDAKLQLAFEITKAYHGAKKAEMAREYFVSTFSKRQTPRDIKIVKARTGDKLVNIIYKSGNSKSISDARRKIEQGGVEIDGRRVADWKMILDKTCGGKIIKIGKYNFIRIKF